jgi:uncharacterized membrane protein
MTMKNIFDTANSRSIFASRAFALILMGILISAVIFSFSSGFAYADSAPLPGELFANDHEKDIKPVQRVYEINSPEGKALVKLDPLKEPYVAEIDNGTRVDVGHIYTDADSSEQWGFFFIDSESGKLPDGIRYNNADGGELTLSWGGSVSGWIPLSDMKLISDDGREVLPKETRDPAAISQSTIGEADESTGTDESASSPGIIGGADGPVSITLGSNIQLLINVLILIIIVLAATLIIVLVIMRKKLKARDEGQERK